MRVASVGALTLGLTICCSSIAATASAAGAAKPKVPLKTSSSCVVGPNPGISPDDPKEFCLVKMFGTTKVIYGNVHMTTQDGANMHGEVHIFPQVPLPSAVTATVSMQNSNGSYIYSIYKTGYSNSQTGYRQVIIGAQYASGGAKPANADVWCSFVIVAPTVAPTP